MRILELPFDAQDAKEVEAEMYTGVVGDLATATWSKKVQLTARWPTPTNWHEATALWVRLESYQIRQIKRNHRNQRPHDTALVQVKLTVWLCPYRHCDCQKTALMGAVLASDAFFPFGDNVEEIAKAGNVKAIIQPEAQSVTVESIEVTTNTAWPWSSQACIL